MKITQEQVRLKNDIVDTYIKYAAAYSKFKKNKKTKPAIAVKYLKAADPLAAKLKILKTKATTLYGEYFTNRCLEIGKTLWGQ